MTQYDPLGGLDNSESENHTLFSNTLQYHFDSDTLYSDRFNKGKKNFGLRLTDPLLIEPFRFGNTTWNVKITLLSTESSLRISLAVAAAKKQMAELTPSSVKSSFIECHASRPKTKHMVLDPNCAPLSILWLIRRCSVINMRSLHGVSNATSPEELE
jgi:hypothetical protein